ncbi:MurR/RpiR family transcriptional regulator [Steroidobacter sp.]|uniref:MurR/RpiR family transcriptional regulator n=1 Tax=Steroidobacter sp. TaxID=1978227 RepID=UPI001A590036|nr:MurR/RpiR family transcriptional regulator [Steroidobacter sp.]MBL8267073.1 MurR/RpiR family transcriptional regulator [Steroidobacter sp.]
MSRNKSAPASPQYRYQSLIQSRAEELSTSEQSVAAHLAAHPEQLPFETADSIAKRLGVSAMTVGRALKALGYKGLGDLRAEMRTELPDAMRAPWANRRAAVTAPGPKNSERARAMRAELEAIESVHALAETPKWQKTVEVIAKAERVFVVGFQTERGIAMAFADQLAYVRPGVQYLSVEGRAFADLRTEANTRSCLVMVDSRRYSRWFRLLAQKAKELQMPLVTATDAYCRWADDLTPHALQVRTDSGRFWDNNAPMASLLNLLLEDVIERLGDSVYAQLEVASEFGATFMGFDRVHRQRAGKGSARSKR